MSDITVPAAGDAPRPSLSPAAPPPVAKGRSLWSDAWRRLTANRAAVVSAVYLVVMTLACLIGPLVTGHDYTTIYTDYVRVPPSLTPYPKQDQIAGALEDVVKRMRVDLVEWHEQDERVSVTVRSARPVDPRVLRYFERSPSFLDPRIEATAPDGLSMTLSAAVARHYFLFGTDNTGRDLLTRTLIAGRVSLAIGLLAGLTAVLIGVTYGAASGFLGGRVDDVMMRFVDILYSLPFIFLVIMLVVFFGRNFVLMFIAVGAVQWLDMARIVRGQALSIRRQEYVQAAMAMGVSPAGILWRHVVPNTLGPVAVYMTLLVPQVILLESFLSYLGLGVQEPLTSWGVLIAQGSKNIPSANWLLIFPSLFLTSTLFALNFLGDGLRDALDPKDR
ncbi:oligopeptide transport system permease protein [Angulomicrobium tetraedrale]|uniref:Oligopeptide transport system permease protein OppC n=1 Tax=Ancylobacter tetraedralis TaxID=217068 RepID=A0A839ZG04_9HYPH|nr:oligopeptide transport system permease protein [Ancylobacter tetraedralis]